MTLETKKLGIYKYNGNDDADFFAGIRLIPYSDDGTVDSYSCNRYELHVVTPDLSMWVYLR